MSSSADSSSSRWWYGVASLPVLAGILYAFQLIALAAQPSGSNNQHMMAFVIGVVGLFFASLLVYLSSIVFSVSLLLDIRALRKKSDEWSPSWWYGLIALIQLGNFVVPILWIVITVPGALNYLYQRRKYTGVPQLNG